MQVLNVAAGGTLVQHLETTDQHFPSEARENADLRGNPVHRVALRNGSHLASLLGETVADVNSLHHQAADFVPDILEVVARSEDGIVEAVEGRGAFQVGVQFHPEDLRHTDRRFQGLFDRLVQQAAS
jgi:putative glutamine amidotransferase